MPHTAKAVWASANKGSTEWKPNLSIVKVTSVVDQVVFAGLMASAQY